ncbi:MAG: hypothetical protein KKH22_00255 [Proteobacteria bacterium]|nr:hypothetical protein [Pseudomonadota bacterium]
METYFRILRSVFASLIGGLRENLIGVLLLSLQGKRIPDLPAFLLIETIGEMQHNISDKSFVILVDVWCCGYQG